MLCQKLKKADILLHLNQKNHMKKSKMHKNFKKYNAKIIDIIEYEFPHKERKT